MDTTERIKQIIELYGFTPSVFADEIEVQRSSISHILSGRNKPSLDLIQKVINRFPDLNPVWLLTGKGEMKQLDIFGNQEENPSDKKENTNVNQPIQEPKQPAEERFTSVNETPPPPPVTSVNPPPPPPVQTPQPPEEPKQTPKEVQEDSVLPFLGSKGKKIEKIVIFYEDKTFSVYHPE